MHLVLAFTWIQSEFADIETQLCDSLSYYSSTNHWLDLEWSLLSNYVTTVKRLKKNSMRIFAFGLPFPCNKNISSFEDVIFPTNALLWM